MGDVSAADAAHYSRLTPRELEVVTRLAAGEVVLAIGERLHLSNHTVVTPPSQHSQGY